MSRLKKKMLSSARAAKIYQIGIQGAVRGFDRLDVHDGFPCGEMGRHYLSTLGQRRLVKTLADLRKSKSQGGQDLFALMELDFKRNGFFVEFGAADGVVHSNSHLLEHGYGWTGILAEPARCWHRKLKRNRKCTIDTRCVWRETGETLTFREHAAAQLSAISQFVRDDTMNHLRQDATEYQVETISLMDLLKSHNAPQRIDFMSIDTEGSEFEILKSFDFDAYDVRVIACEHGFSPVREDIHDLLSSRGYSRKHPDLSHMDDWYVKTA